RTSLGPLPQHFADRFGWEELAAAVAQTYNALPEDERARVLIVTSNYGEAGALRYFGRRYALPLAVSPPHSYFLWGPGRRSAELVIAVGMSAAAVRDAFESVREGRGVESRYAMPYETRRPILVCRGLKIPLAEAWAGGKRYI